METRIAGYYSDILTPLAEAYHYSLPPFPRPSKGKPSVVFLGNHSSGKSTFINHLLGVPLQKTGVAPTDDGFTIITHGNAREESRGPATVGREDFPFSGMENLGPGFLSRLRLKNLPSPILNGLNLIDSPGMIDSAATSSERGYDFMETVRYFATNADLILFFFDPEKPGTTGETVAAFTESLSGLEHKVLIVLNKVDTFENIRDFARDYGSLCWNLARVVRTKDLPHIFTMYVPTGPQKDENGDMPLRDFDDSRQEVIQEIKNAPARRSDNLIANLREQALRLEIFVRVARAIRSYHLKLRWQRGGITAAVVGLTALVLWLFGGDMTWQKYAGTVLAGVGLAFLVWFSLGFLIRQKQKAKQADLDSLFAALYGRDLTLARREDLTVRWQSIKPKLEAVLENLGVDALPCASWSLRRLLRKLPELQTMRFSRKAG